MTVALPDGVSSDTNRAIFEALTYIVPADDAVNVTPSDSVDLESPARSLFIGGAGDVAVVTVAGNTVTITGVTAGSILPIRVQRVNTTNTTATNIVALL